MKFPVDFSSPLANPGTGCFLRRRMTPGCGSADCVVVLHAALAGKPFEVVSGSPFDNRQPLDCVSQNGLSSPSGSVAEEPIVDAPDMPICTTDVAPLR